MTDYGDVPITVALVAEERHLGNRALVDAQAAWHAHGCRVEVLVPDAPRFYDVSVQTPPWSVVVSRGRHLAGLETVLLRRWVVLPKRWSTLSSPGSVGPVTRWPPSSKTLACVGTCAGTRDEGKYRRSGHGSRNRHQ